MLYQVVILVCGMGMPMANCDRDTAYDVIVSPEQQPLGMCAVHGQQYIAGTAISLQDSYVKVQCRASGSVAYAGKTAQN